MLRRTALLLAAILLFIVTSASIYLVLQSYLEQPMKRIYQFVLRVAEVAPQDWIWAAIVGLIVLISLRSLSARRETSTAKDSLMHYRAEGLDSWLGLLQERSKGGYFRWRLASQLAELESSIGGDSKPSTNPEVQEYLRQGRTRRTIHIGDSISDDAVLIGAVVAHLEKLEHGD